MRLHAVHPEDSWRRNAGWPNDRPGWPGVAARRGGSRIRCLDRRPARYEAGRADREPNRGPIGTGQPGKHPDAPAPWAHSLARHPGAADGPRGRAAGPPGCARKGPSRSRGGPIGRRADHGAAMGRCAAMNIRRPLLLRLVLLLCVALPGAPEAVAQPARHRRSGRGEPQRCQADRPGHGAAAATAPARRFLQRWRRGRGRRASLPATRPRRQGAAAAGSHRRPDPLRPRHLPLGARHPDPGRCERRRGDPALPGPGRRPGSPCPGGPAPAPPRPTR